MREGISVSPWVQFMLIFLILVYDGSKKTLHRIHHFCCCRRSHRRRHCYHHHRRDVILVVIIIVVIVIVVIFVVVISVALVTVGDLFKKSRCWDSHGRKQQSASSFTPTRKKCKFTNQEIKSGKKKSGNQPGLIYNSFRHARLVFDRKMTNRIQKGIENL